MLVHLKIGNGIKYKGGGQGEIRTHGTVTRTLVFKTRSLNHSDTCPFVIPLITDSANYFKIKISIF